MRCKHCNIRLDYFQSTEHAHRPNCYTNTYHEFTAFPRCHQWYRFWGKACMALSPAKVVSRIKFQKSEKSEKMLELGRRVQGRYTVEE